MKLDTIETREIQTEQHSPDMRRPQHAPEKKSRRGLWVALAALVFVALVIVAGVLPRIQARTELRHDTAQLAVPVVVVVSPKPAAAQQEVVLPANVQAYIDAPIYARTNGYLKKWYADIGARVKAGQLLAEIDTPEVNQQLRQARADLATAEANSNLSKITAERYNGLLQTDSVSKQEADNATGDFQAKQAMVQSGEANVHRLQDLQSFQKIYAPFSGVITARNTDIGALVDSGAAGGTRTELFHIVQPDKLRVYVNVPEVYASAARPGLTADLTFAEYPGKRFTGKLVRTSEAISQNTRTLLVEISVDNPTGQLFSGAYAQVHLKLPSQGEGYIIPVDTLLFRSEGLRVAAVDDKKKVQLKPITIARDFGREVQVASGIEGNEQLIVNPPDSVFAGQTVRLADNTNDSSNSNSGGNGSKK